MLVNLFTGFSKSTFAMLIIDDSAAEVFFGELRPQAVGEVEFRVSELPQQEVTDTQFAAGTDKQVRVRDAGGGEIRRDGGLIYLFRLQASFGGLASDAARHVGYLPAGGIAERQDQTEPRITGGLSDAIQELKAGILRQTTQIADGQQTYIVIHERRRLKSDGIHE